MYQRSFSLGLNNGQADNLYNFFVNEGVSNNGQVGVVRAANEIGSSIRLNATPTGMANIPKLMITPAWLITYKDIVNITIRHLQVRLILTPHFISTL